MDLQEQTLKIWHKFSRARSRNSWLFFKHSPLSSGSDPAKVLLSSAGVDPNQDKKEVLAANWLDCWAIFWAMCVACAIIWTSLRT